MAIEEQVQEEVEKYFSRLDSFEQSRILRYGEENKEWMLKDNYLNNFYLFFINPNPNLMIADSHRGMLNKPYADLTFMEYITQNGFSTEGYSKLYLSQTPRQFLGTIDQTVQELGIDPQRLRELSGNMCDGPFGATISATNRKELTKKFLFPIYVKLREKGYSHRELIM